MALLLSLCILVSMVFSERIQGREPIECDGFKTQQCLDLVYQYYGLTASELSVYGSMQQAVLADTIECHYRHDICPFYIPPVIGEKKECIDGRIAFIDETDDINHYECKDVDLLSFVPMEHLGSNNNASGADIWGYQTVDTVGNVNKHYAITSQADGSSIVDVTDPLHPNVLAFIVSNVDGGLRNVLWRDVKVYKNWAIVVADTGGINDHGIQIYNLDTIIEAAEEYQSELDEDVSPEERVYIISKGDERVIIYDQVGRCHNVYVDNEIGHLYGFGSNGTNGNNCGSGIHIIDINDPENPEFMGCYDGALYVHDAQCVRYHGPDPDYQDHEICFMFTPDVGNLTIVDITDPADIIEISSTTYFTNSYNHQGWVTSNQEYLLLDDETDEGPLPEDYPVTQNRTTTYIFDIRDLDNVDYRRAHHSEILAVDHNQYIVDNGHKYSSNHDRYRGYTFQANYEAGLRILSIDNIANENGNELEEIAYFDLFPWKLNANGSSIYDEIKFFGAWSVYPYFNKLGTNPNDYVYSNKLIVQSTATGLYVVEFNGNMDFSVDSDTSDGFEWDSWYGVILIVGIIILVVLSGFIGYKIYKKRSKKKRMGVYESIVGMEKSNQYGASEGDKVDTTARL